MLSVVDGMLYMRLLVCCCFLTHKHKEFVATESRRIIAEQDEEYRNCLDIDQQRVAFDTLGLVQRRYSMHHEMRTQRALLYVPFCIAVMAKGLYRVSIS